MKKPLPGTRRQGFAVGTKGYIATGYDAKTSSFLKDCWQYDPATNDWKQMADFPGGGRRYALSFGIGQYGYLGTGYDDNYQKDFTALTLRRAIRENGRLSMASAGRSDRADRFLSLMT